MLHVLLRHTATERSNSNTSKDQWRAFFSTYIKEAPRESQRFCEDVKNTTFFFLMDSMTSTTHRNTKMHLPSTAFPKIP
jgi:hypothetical protein